MATTTGGGSTGVLSTDGTCFLFSVMSSFRRTLRSAFLTLWMANAFGLRFLASSISSESFFFVVFALAFVSAHSFLAFSPLILAAF